MTRGAVGPTALAGELTLALDHVSLEPDVAPPLRSNETPLPLDDAPELRRVEYLPLARRYIRDDLDPVQGVGHRELLVFEVCEEFDAEFDGIVHTVAGSGDHKAFARRDTALT